MLPTLKKIDNTIPAIFHYLKVDDPHFYPLWHFHPQCEIILIEKGTGTLYIGDGIDRFAPGDIYMLGPNIPHLFRSFPEYFSQDSTLRSEAKVLYFSPDFLGEGFLELNEALPIKNLVQASRQGIKLAGGITKRASGLITTLTREEGIARIIRFMELLNLIISRKDNKLMSSAGFNYTHEEKEVDRLNTISDFLHKNFTRTIRLQEVAAFASMSETAFCRYFKEKTGKTFITYLNEIRIGYACKLLIEKPQLNISQICFRSGFNNLTNFNVQFKKIKSCSPLEYRQRYLTAVSIPVP